MNADEKILQVLEELQADVAAMKGDIGKLPGIEAGTAQLQADVNTIKTDVQTLQDGQAHTHTVLKTLATKQDVEVAVDAAQSELAAKLSEVKADVLMLASKVVKRIQSHERRLTNIAEQEGMDNPEKNSTIPLILTLRSGRLSDKTGLSEKGVPQYASSSPRTWLSEMVPPVSDCSLFATSLGNCGIKTAAF